MWLPTSTVVVPIRIRASMTAPLLTSPRRSPSTPLMLWPIITVLWPHFFRRTTRRPGPMSNVSSKLVASPISNSSGTSARRQAGRINVVWYRGVIHAMAVEQTQDSARRLEHLLLTREIEEFLYAEAALLDERRFEKWLALFTADIADQMPRRRNIKVREDKTANKRPSQHNDLCAE